MPRRAVAADGHARVNQNIGVWVRGFRLVMIGDDEFDAEFAGQIRLGDAGNAAIDRDDQLKTLAGEFLQSIGIEAIAVVEAVWDMEIEGLRTEVLEAGLQEGR